MLALLGFMTIVVILLPHINPPTQPAGTVDPPGNVIVEVRWADDSDADVDLWTQAPHDRPIGYSNPGGLTFNLLRDDLGMIGDATGLNYEIAFSRGVPSGEYAVNLHLYRNDTGLLRVPATVVVRMKRGADAPSQLLFRKEVVLNHVGEELTVVRFALDASGGLVAGSVNELPKSLRAAQTARR